ncbi:MAG TPA: hypothetical protein VJ553_02795 [Candidatus Paceibacterota bacterium]|nr:hypothetical protein [Candidatus Paceibacterota bacterium]
MKRWYSVYLAMVVVLGLAAAALLVPKYHELQRNVSAIQQASQVSAPPAVDPQVMAERQAQAMERLVRAREAAEQARRIKVALGAEAATFNAEIAKRPKPAPVTGYAPSQGAMRNAYSNANLKPAPKLIVPSEPPSNAHVIIDFAPSDANSLDWQAAVASKRCAAFSFVDASGTTVNRLFCDPVVAH